MKTKKYSAKSAENQPKNGDAVFLKKEMQILIEKERRKKEMMMEEMMMLTKGKTVVLSNMNY